MMVVKLILLAIVALFACVQGDFTAEDKEFLKNVFADVPVEARQEFLIDQLHLGYILKHPQPKFLMKTNDVTSRLYDIYSGDEMRSERVQLQAKICFDDGTCIDTGDSGIYP